MADFLPNSVGNDAMPSQLFRGSTPGINSVSGSVLSCQTGPDKCSPYEFKVTFTPIVTPPTPPVAPPAPVPNSTINTTTNTTKNQTQKPTNATCVNCSQTFDLASGMYDPKSSTVMLMFSELITREVDTQQLKIYVKDEVGNTEIECTEATCVPTYVDNGFKVLLKFTETIIKGTFIIEWKSQTGTPIVNLLKTKVFKQYPIRVGGIRNQGTNPPASVKAAENAGQMSKSYFQTIRSTATLSTTFAFPMGSMSADKLVAEFTFLRLVEGPFLSYPAMILDALSSTGMLPIDIPNPTLPAFGLEMNDTFPTDGCVPPQNYVSNNYTCNILANFGKDLVVLVAFLLLNIVISIGFICWIFKPKEKNEKPKTWLRRSIDSFARSFGIKYFIAKVDGMSLQLLIFAVLNASNFTLANMLGVVGFSISCVLIFYYFIYIALLFKLVADVKKLRLAEQAEINTSPTPVISPRDEKTSNKESKLLSSVDNKKEDEKDKEKKELIEVVDLRMSRLWFAGAVYEECQFPKRLWFLYTPIVSIIRQLLLSAICALLAGYGIFQPAILAGLQLVFAIWTIVAGVKASRYDNFKDAFDQVMEFLYLACKAVTFMNFEEEFRQNILGGAMAVMLILMVLNNIVYLMVILVITWWEIIKKLFSYCKGKNKVEPVEGNSASPSKNEGETDPFDEKQAKVSPFKPVHGSDPSSTELISRNSGDSPKSTLFKKAMRKRTLGSKQIPITPDPYQTANLAWTDSSPQHRNIPGKQTQINNK